MKKPDPPDSLTKRVIDHVTSRIAKIRTKHPRRLITESLEPRILFSGSPIPPLDAPVPPSPQAQEAPPTPIDATVDVGHFDLSSPLHPESEPTDRVFLSRHEIEAIDSLSGSVDRRLESAPPITSDLPILVEGLGSAASVGPDALAVLPGTFNSPGFGWTIFVDRLAPSETIADDTPTGPSGEADGWDEILPDTSTTAGDPGSAETELLIDPSLLESISAADNTILYDSAETVEVTIVGFASVVGTVADRQSHADAEARHTLRGRHSFRPLPKNPPSRDSLFYDPLTLTTGASSLVSETNEVLISGDFSEDHTVVTADGWLGQFTPATVDASEGFDFPSITGTISIGQFSSSKQSRETDRLFVDRPPGFDFTALQTGDYRKQILASNPQLYSPSESLSGKSTVKGKQQYKKKSKAPALSLLGGSLSGTQFTGVAFTLEVWLNARSSSGQQTLFAIEDEHGLPRAISCELDGSSLNFRHRLAGFRYREQNFSIPDAVAKCGVWHHLVFSRDGRDIAVFLDGEEVYYADSDGSGLSIFGPNVVFELESFGSLSRFDGQLSEFAFYDRALDHHTIAAHYHAGFAHGPFKIERKRKARNRKSESKMPTVFVGGDGWVSKSASQRKSAEVASGEVNPIDGVETTGPDQNEISIVQSLLDRIADHDFGQVTNGNDLGIFVSRKSHGIEAEVKNLNWDVAEEILAHFGVAHCPKSTKRGDYHSLFISGGKTDEPLRGFVAEVAKTGRISSITPLEFEFDMAGPLASADIFSALKMPVSTAIGSRWSARNDSPFKGDNHLDKVSSVQSDVFGIRE